MARNCKKSCECNRQYVVWLDCPGEAHKNPFIDNCGMCMPNWGRYPVCPNCTHCRLVDSAKEDTMYCRGCKGHYYL